MGHLLYLMFRCDRRCDGKFGNFVGTEHSPSRKCEDVSALVYVRRVCLDGGKRGCEKSHKTL